MLKSLVASYERFLRIPTDGPLETTMRLRAVWVIASSLAVMEFCNLFVLQFNYHYWTSDHTVTSIVCLVCIIVMQFLRWYKNVFHYWLFFSALLLAGIFMSAWPNQTGINSALIPFIALGPVMSSFMVGRRGAFAFWVIGSVFLCVLFWLTLSLPSAWAPGDYSRDVNRFVQGFFALSMATVMAVKLSEQLYIALADLEKNAERANNAEAAKSEFLATMSHELRTPLNGVIGLTDALMGAQLPQRERALVRTIRESGESLLLILNDLLDISKVEAGKLSIAPRENNPRKIVRDVVDSWRETATAKGLFIDGHVTGEIPEMVMMDDLRVRQILQNLFSNGVKFTSHGHVSMHLLGAQLGDGRYQLDFKVTDTGKGIPPEMMGLIFEPFEQGERGTTRQFGGTGLGLPISQMLAELMDGSIRIERSDASGTTFVLSLVVEQVITQAEGASEDIVDDMYTPDIALQGLKVLVAEDNEINSMVARELLSVWGMDVQFAVDGRSCVDRIRQESFDLILMDKHMPGMNGVEATKAIRAMSGSVAKVPIIAATADALPGEREAMLEAGMNDFIAKPLRVEALRVVMLRVLEASDAA